MPHTIEEIHELLTERVDRFLTVDEMVQDMLLILPDDDRAHLRKLKKGQLIQLHFSLGRWFRNRYLLWDAQNPLTMLGYVPNLGLSADGVTVDQNPKHPDAVSMQLIERLWRKLQYTT